MTEGMTKVTNPTPEDARLNEFDKDEWRDVARLLDRNFSDEKFDVDWAEFVAMKQRRKAN